MRKTLMTEGATEAFKVHFINEVLSLNKDAKKVPIRGWLIAVAVLIWIWFFYALLAIIGLIANAVLSAKGMPLTIHGSREWIEFIVTATVPIFLWVLYIKRRRDFVIWFVIYAVFDIAYSVWSLVARAGSRESLITNAIPHILAVVYLIASKRVKNTFVR